MNASTRIFVAALFMTLILSVSVSAPAQQAQNVLRYVGFSPVPPADKLECRLAVAYAVNRDAIASALSARRLLGTGAPAYSIQSPRLPGYDASIRWPSFDAAKAKEYYAQCGWQGPLVIATGQVTTDFTRTLASALQESLRSALGVQVNLDQADDFNTLVSKIRAGRIAIHALGWQADPRDYGYPSMALGLANELFQDPEVRELVAKRDGPATERLLLQKMWAIPILIF